MAILHVPAPAGGLAPAIHRDWRRLEGSALAFLDRWELYADGVRRERLIRMGLGRLTALMYPEGAYELLRIGTDFAVWALALDDEHGDEGALSTRPAELVRALGRMQRALESPEAPYAGDDRYTAALVDVRRRLAALAPPSHVGRFVEAVRTCLMTEMWKAVDLRPSLDDAVAMSLFGGGGWVFPTMAHVMAGVPSPQDAFEDRRLRALGEMAAGLAIWDTDIGSFGTERERGPGRGRNLVTVIAREQRCAPQEALLRLIGIRRRVLGLFLRLRTAVLRDAPPAVTAYVAGLGLCYRGSPEWSLHDPHPPEESSGPPDIPSIAWWWRYDPAR